MKSKIPLIELRNVSKKYLMGESTVVALDNVSLKVFSGELITITGASGSGKSTLLHMLGLLDLPTEGKIFVSGRNVSFFSEAKLSHLRNQTIGFVFQQFNLLARTTVLENVTLPFLYNPHLDAAGAQKRAKEILTEVGLTKRIGHFPNQLSGGEQQRVAIARALMCNPGLILTDEPTGNLDSKIGKEIMDLLLELNKKTGKTLIIVTHDPELAKVGKRKIYLSDGKIVKEGK